MDALEALTVSGDLDRHYNVITLGTRHWNVRALELVVHGHLVTLAYRSSSSNLPVLVPPRFLGNPVLQ